MMESMRVCSSMKSMGKHVGKESMEKHHINLVSIKNMTYPSSSLVCDGHVDEDGTIG